MENKSISLSPKDVLKTYKFDTENRLKINNKKFTITKIINLQIPNKFQKGKIN